MKMRSPYICPRLRSMEKCATLLKPQESMDGVRYNTYNKFKNHDVFRNFKVDKPCINLGYFVLEMIESRTLLITWYREAVCKEIKIKVYTTMFLFQIYLMHRLRNWFVSVLSENVDPNPSFSCKNDHPLIPRWLRQMTAGASVQRVVRRMRAKEKRCRRQARGCVYLLNSQAVYIIH